LSSEKYSIQYAIQKPANALLSVLYDYFSQELEKTKKLWQLAVLEQVNPLV
jgi:hypothetical protein